MKRIEDGQPIPDRYYTKVDMVESRFGYHRLEDVYNYKGGSYDGGPHALRKGQPLTAYELGKKVMAILREGDELAELMERRIKKLEGFSGSGKTNQILHSIFQIVCVQEQGIPNDTIVTLIKESPNIPYVPEGKGRDIFDHSLDNVFVQIDAFPTMREIVGDEVVEKLLTMYPANTAVLGPNSMRAYKEMLLGKRSK